MVRNRNYMPKRQKMLLIGAGTVVAVGITAGIVWAVNQPAAPTADPTPSITQVTTPAPPPTTATPTPQPTTATPSIPPADVDTSKPENVAVAWAKAYFDRPTGTDQTYLSKIEPYIDPSLREYMRTDEFNIDGKGYFDQTEGTRVLDVKVTPQDGTGGRDTPTRWTRTVTVSVQGLTTGKTADVPYTLSLFRADTYWFIASAPKQIQIRD